MKRSVLITAIANVLLGSMALYWGLLSRWSSIYVLAHRMLWTIPFGLIFIAISGKQKELKQAFHNKRALGISVLSGLAVAVNWALYIWAVLAGMVADTSLGFYMSPLFVFVFGVVCFHEKCTKWEWIAVGFAAAGIVVATVAAGSFPLAAVGLAVTFALYGALKKWAGLDAAVSVTVEMIVMLPVSLIYLGVTSFGPAGQLTGAHWWEILLLICAGFASAFPLWLYGKGVNDLPLSMVGFIQYIWPTTSLLVSVFIIHEEIPAYKWVSFSLIWVGLLVFSVSKLLEQKKQVQLKK